MYAWLMNQQSDIRRVKKTGADLAVEQLTILYIKKKYIFY